LLVAINIQALRLARNNFVLILIAIKIIAKLI